MNEGRWLLPPPVEVAVPTVSVDCSSPAMALGAAGTLAAFREEAAALGRRASVREVGSLGVCPDGVVADATVPGSGRVFYRDVTPELARRIVREHLGRGVPVREFAVAQAAWGKGAASYPGIIPLERSPWFRGEVRLVSRRLGLVEPGSLSEYRATGGYLALERCLASLSPEDVLSLVTASGLRGKGGGWYPTGAKWRRVAAHRSDMVFVAAAATEGDPGIAMHRLLLEGDPHAVIEGMAIAAYAVGSRKGYFVIDAEDVLCLERFRNAVEAARAGGFLGRDILGGRFTFDLEIRPGGGAFIGGEETALISFLEGKRGIPRPRPPFPADEGLGGYPTLVNNIETLATIPFIIAGGLESFRGIGTPTSPGTKVLWLSGAFRRQGLVEVPFGMTLQELIDGPGGGVDSPVKAIHVGGVLGRSYPASEFSTPLEYGSGALVGSGGVIALPESACMVETAAAFLRFTQRESCGSCTPCRAGTQVMLELLERFASGRGRSEEIPLLEEIAETVTTTSLCGFGRMATGPVVSGLKHFRDEYRRHAEGRTCSARHGGGL